MMMRHGETTPFDTMGLESQFDCLKNISVKSLTDKGKKELYDLGISTRKSLEKRGVETFDLSMTSTHSMRTYQSALYFLQGYMGRSFKDASNANLNTLLTTLDEVTNFFVSRPEKSYLLKASALEICPKRFPKFKFL